MKYLMLIAAAVLAIALPACTSSDAQTKDTTAITAPAVDKNQQIADRYARVAPKELASLCHYSELYPGMIRKQMTNILGAQIINAGGDVTTVTELLLARC